MAWLGDTVFSVRHAAVENLQRMADHFGEEWAKEQVLPVIDRMHVHTSYLQRMTALYGVQYLVPSLTGETIDTLLLPLVIEMCSDAVPNIRFTAAKCLELIVSKTDGSKPAIVSALEKLITDSDRDVCYYAQKVRYRSVCVGEVTLI